MKINDKGGKFDVDVNNIQCLIYTAPDMVLSFGRSRNYDRLKKGNAPVSKLIFSELHKLSWRSEQLIRKE